jgi:hypothetical protein
VSTPADRSFAEARAQGLPDQVEDPVALRKAAHLMSKPPIVDSAEPTRTPTRVRSAGSRVGRNGTHQDPRQGSPQTVRPDPAA